MPQLTQTSAGLVPTVLASNGLDVYADEVLSGIDARFYNATTFEAFYHFGYRDTLFDMLRGGKGSFIEEYQDISHGKGFVRDFESYSSLPANKVPADQDLGKSTRITTRGLTHSVAAGYWEQQYAVDMLEHRAIALPTQYAQNRPPEETLCIWKLTEAYKKDRVKELCEAFLGKSSLTNPQPLYTNARNGAMPLSSRTCIGRLPLGTYLYAQNATWQDRIGNAINIAVGGNDIRADEAFAQVKMSVAHIRNLVLMASSSPLGNRKIEPIRMTLSRTEVPVYCDRYILLLTTNALNSLYEDELFREIVITNPRTDLTQAPVTETINYHGRIHGCDIFKMPTELEDTLRELTALPDWFDVSIFGGASAVAQITGATVLKPLANSDDIDNNRMSYVIKWISGADSLRFFVPSTLTEKRADNSKVPATTKTEQGLLYSITCNKRVADVTA